jgi:dTDP-glucose pyrophosphorylase
MKFPGDLCVAPATTLRQTLEVMTRGSRQIALVVGDRRHLAGLVTDGDIRRALLRGVPLDGSVTDAMNRTPVVGPPGLGRDDAVARMTAHSIRHLPLVDEGGRLVEVLFLEELIAPPPLSAMAVVMAGGMGTRLRPLTEEVPKPLLRVGGKPLLEILIERLHASGVSEVVIAVHHKSGMIREQLGDGRRLGVKLGYVEEPERLGTIGALRLIDPPPRRAFFVINGDILTRCDFRALWEFHAERRAAMTVAVSLHQVDIPYGEIVVAGERVRGVEEKPRKEFTVNSGIYLIEPGVIPLIPDRQYFDATDLIRLLVARGETIAAYRMQEYWLDVGHLHDLEKARRDVAEGLLA